ncbi:MAG: serine/threonine-protein kinase RsbW [Thermoleophilaceae bacterium]|jgi:anti-sigma regulatory factor (Ser/Thr protein kinase)|nr:serine/threonine-protein kinase RsbW [Thermoleophilaceae bacterium]
MYWTAPNPHTTALDTRIPGGPAACGTARDIVERLVGDATPADTLHDALLLTSELVTNAVLHGGVDETGVVDLHVASDPSLLRISVTDPGGESTPAVQDLDVTVPGGMGLFLVEQISSRWGVDELRDGGTQVWFELVP